MTLTEQPEKTPEQIASMEAAMRSEGVPTEELIQDDYFGVDQTYKVYLPDRISFLEHKEMDEGQRRKYLNKTNRGLKVQKVTGDAQIDLKPGDDRRELILNAVVGWNLQSRGQAVQFSRHNLENWLDVAPPRIVDMVEKDIRLKNSWLQGEMTLEDIDRELETLQKLRQQKLEEAEGKDA